ncbi:MAG: hypothetical protein K6F07_00575 [Bacilli bacterium]|nr:hypothetical protein [Bacilli bacterium]
MEISRNQQHYIVMTVIYDEINDYVYNGGHIFRDARDLIAGTAGMPYEEVDPYVINCVNETLKHYGEIINAYTPFLKNWKWDRLPGLTQAILLMSYAHFYYVEKVEKRIVISVAIDLAKKYIDEKQAKFVHAILDGVLK